MEKSNIKILFVCMYGQSRSRFFAEYYNKQGVIANFCGYVDDADIQINISLVETYDLIVILDRYFERTGMFSYINQNKPYILCYIEDMPENFKEYINTIDTLIQNYPEK